MFPIALDLTRIPVLLTGSGELLLRRIHALDEAGAAMLAIFCPDPTEDIRTAAGTRLVAKLPTASDVRDYSVILIAGLERRQAEPIVISAQALGRLVNVEDVNDLCDFYFTANIRRGDLVIAVSTSGASPTLARRIRDVIGGAFGEEWTQRVREIADLRRLWKSEGKDMKSVVESTDRHLAEKGWIITSSVMLGHGIAPTPLANNDPKKKEGEAA